MPARVRSARASSIPTTGWSPRSSARSTTSSSSPWPLPQQALEDAGWKADTPEKQERSGVLIGSGIGGLSGIAETSLLLKEKGPRRVSPFFIPGRLINLASGYVSIRHGLKGPNHAVVTACSTGAHAIGDASRLIAMDDADVMVAGGAESPICRIGVAGFAACRALSTAFNDRPHQGLAPLRQGPRRLRHRRGRRASSCWKSSSMPRRAARASMPRWSATACRATPIHITAPAEDGDGAYRSMRMALKRAGIEPSDIQYVNAHGTSTPMGDEIELAAVERLFGNAAGKLAMSSTKSAVGHLLGAAGAVEAIYSVLAIRDNIAPPTLNLDNPSVETAIDLVPHKAQKRADRHRALQLVRFRRHQRVARPAAAGGVSTRVSPLAHASTRVQQRRCAGV